MTDRHTLAKAYQDSQDLLRAQATRPHAEPTSDVEVTRNAKQEYQFKVAVTMHDPDAAFLKAIELADALEVHYPSGQPSTAALMEQAAPTIKAQLEATLADEVGAKRRGKPKS